MPCSEDCHPYIFWMFQSAPGREAGRCGGVTIIPTYDAKFQSAPGREAGRCPLPPSACPAPCGFNPRPAVRPGDAASLEADMQGMRVSIRARP